MLSLLGKICPQFDFKGEPIEQLKVGINSLMEEQTSSPVHQLALVTAIRQLFTRVETVASTFATEALSNTFILSIISRILDCQAVGEEFYFLKLEALWILINLSMCETDEA